MIKYRRVGFCFPALLLGGAVASFLGLGCSNNGSGEPVYTGKTGGTSGTPATGGVAGFDAGMVDAAAVPDAETIAFSKAALIAAIAECTALGGNTFQSAAQALHDKLVGYAANLSPEALSQAQEAWRIANAHWQAAELFQIGPAASSGRPGGQGLRTQIYSYPQKARCGVDQLIATQGYSRTDFANTLVVSRGLDALEYLLFHTGTNNACPSTADINTQGTWAAVSPTVLPQRRADYAVAAAADVLARAQQINTAWLPGGANFRQQFVSAGAGSTLFATDHDALNAASDAFFYLDREIKDQKICCAAGSLDCSACVPYLEAEFARSSTQNVAQNLRGFRQLFSGCADGVGLGFDDWLRAVGQNALADAMNDALADAIVATDTFTPPLEDAFSSSKENVGALHTKIKILNDLLKTQFITALNLDLPMTVEGDND
ncbi:MAG: imelysin family protein [Deltaproteobacteria bacterium]|nr:imelysin family protein [Deltaproteobacteria bacterium]